MVIGKVKKLDILPLKRLTCEIYALNPRKSVLCHFRTFLVLFSEKFCTGYGSTLWFCRGTYLPKIWASPSHLGEQNFPTQTSNIFATLFHGILVFFQEFPSGGTQYLLLSDQVLIRAKSPRGTKGLTGGGGAPLAHCGRTPS